MIDVQVKLMSSCRLSLDQRMDFDERVVEKLSKLAGAFCVHKHRQQSISKPLVHRTRMSYVVEYQNRTGKDMSTVPCP